jgi:sigma-B regulation protein RsbU (phosphoserine phosphatase)
MAILANDLKTEEQALDTFTARVLVADDQPDILEALRLFLKTHGYVIETANSPASVLRALESNQYDLVLMDLNYARDTTSGREGLDLLSALQGIESAPPVVAMTGWATVGLAVEAMQHGVRDFVEKPWANDRLLEIVRTQVDRGRQERASRSEQRLAAQLREKHDQVVNRQAGEIDQARSVQVGLLPREIPQFPGVEISGAWQPAREMSGDYFDVLKLDDHRFAFCIADVAGKGVAAALLMSNLQATVRGLAAPESVPGDLCTRANGFVCRNLSAESFITFFFGIFDVRSQRAQYSNAGHNAPMLLRSNGGCERLTEGGALLGVLPHETYATADVQFAPGDRLVLFTDGVTEAQDAEGTEFGEERLLDILSQCRTRSGHEIQEEVLRAVKEFSARELQDDATLLVLACTA